MTEKSKPPYRRNVGGWIRSKAAKVRDRYHSIVWIHFWLTMSSCITGFMLYPYLVVYMTEQLGASAVAAAGAISFPSFIAIFFKLWAGNISDRFGRRPVLFMAPMFQFIVLIGMIFANEVWHFYVLLTLNGLSSNLYLPAKDAQMADIVSEKQRTEAYALNNVAINIGATLGPLLGIAAYHLNPSLIFCAEAGIALVTATVVYFKIPETLPQAEQDSTGPTQRKVLLGIGAHFPLYLLILFAVPVYMVEMQMNSTMPLYLKTQFVEYLLVYGTLRTVTGILTAVLQMPVTLWSQRWRGERVVMISYFLLIAYSFFYGFMPYFWLLVVAEFCWTMTDMLLLPRLKQIVSIMANSQVRARYFSLFDISLSVGKMTAPVLGSVVLVQYGGKILFGGLGALLLLAGVGQAILVSRVLSADKRKKEQTPEAAG
ncbi:MFS family permease [Kroppenstedtia sanguinis]|uniref:MFS transporter n=1 Tax=Kroppenstedtia sanguinis TaxID=1380684 RepID=A0ABW4C9B0_9BACL